MARPGHPLVGRLRHGAALGRHVSLAVHDDRGSQRAGRLLTRKSRRTACCPRPAAHALLPTPSLPVRGRLHKPQGLTPRPHILLGAPNAQDTCKGTNFSRMYNYPFRECVGKTDDGSLTFFNQLLLLWPSVVLWGLGTAIGELPPYFVTRAARRAGKRATDFEEELNEAKEKTDIVSKLKVRTGPSPSHAPKREKNWTGLPPAPQPSLHPRAAAAPCCT